MKLCSQPLSSIAFVVKSRFLLKNWLQFSPLNACLNSTLNLNCRLYNNKQLYLKLHIALPPSLRGIENLAPAHLVRLGLAFKIAILNSFWDVTRKQFEYLLGLGPIGVDQFMHSADFLSITATLDQLKSRRERYRPIFINEWESISGSLCSIQLVNFLKLSTTFRQWRLFVSNFSLTWLLGLFLTRSFNWISLDVRVYRFSKQRIAASKHWTEFLGIWQKITCKALMKWNIIFYLTLL